LAKDLNKSTKLGTLSTLLIGIGGMVGGGIFAVTGLSIDVTKGGAPIAFIIAGIVGLFRSGRKPSYQKSYLDTGGNDTAIILNRNNIPIVKQSQVAMVMKS